MLSLKKEIYKNKFNLLIVLIKKPKIAKLFKLLYFWFFLD